MVIIFCKLFVIPDEKESELFVFLVTAISINTENL